MKILVIIVTYNAMQWADRCFDSLRKSTVKPDVFVVDNGSTDGTQAYIQEHYPEVMFHQSEKNIGFGKANNLGMQYALDNDYDYVYLLNQDAWVMEDTFEKLIEISKNNSEYGILSPFQMNADMYHIDKSFMSNVCSFHLNPDIINDFYSGNYKEVYEAKSVMAAHWLLPRKTLMEVGGFSPSFPHYGEDDNYQSRVVYHGMKIGASPLLKVVHDRGMREKTASKIIYLGYIRSISLLSDPSQSSLGAFFYSIYIVFRNIVKYKSVKPLSYWMEYVCGIRKILQNKRLSITQKHAFLHE